MSRLPRIVSAMALAAPLLTAAPVVAQDTTAVPTPAAELEALLSDPDNLNFQRAWIQKVDGIRANRAALEAQVGPQLTRPELITAGAALTGELKVATLGALYAGQTGLFTATDYENKLFSMPGSGYSVRKHWNEMSLGVFQIGGTVPTWPNLPQDASYYRPLGGDDRFGKAGEFLKHTLDAVDPGLDFGQFDNDGPDGVPNSGDDDGFVDVAAFLYQDAAMSCGGPGIWPHRWTYGGWWSGASYQTNDVSANGGFIQVSDYMIQSGVGCDGTSLMEIGTYSHELGHALGLPDLYDTNGGSAGIGVWGLMGSGNWNVQSSPAHLGAWSKDFLGWLNIEMLSAEQSGMVLDPVYNSGQVLRYDLPLTPEYFLMEHRSATGSDAFIRGEGLLVWHIDPTRTSNQDETRKWVDLEEADGLDELDAGASSGDTGDPYPGSSGASAFGPGSYPNSGSYDGLISGFGLENIQRVGGQVSFDVVLSTDPFLIAETPALAAGVGGTAVDTISVAAHDGSSVGVKATWSQSWLTVAPDTAQTPVSMIVTADGASLSAGFHSDTLVISSGAAGNSPVRIPVLFHVTTNLIALGDTLVGRFDVANEVDTFYIALSAGDTVDLAVFPLGGDPIGYARVDLLRPDGTVLDAFGGERRWTRGPCCSYVALKGGFLVPVSGTYALAVYDGWGGLGDYVVKARSAGPILSAEPSWNGPDIEGVAGSGVVQDTVWIWNSGPTSATWAGSSASTDIVMSPTGGTLPGLGLTTESHRGEVPVGASPARPTVGVAYEAELAPAGATPVLLDVDLSGFAPGAYWYNDVLSFSLSDFWGGDIETGVEVWAQDPSVSVVADGLWYGVSGLATRSDGHVALTVSGDLMTLDPSTGQLSTWAADVTPASNGIWGMDLEPDGSALLADRYQGALKRVRPDGSMETLWTPGEAVYDVAITPDGTIYAMGWGQGLTRINGDGTTTAISSQGTSGHYAVAYSPADGGVILFGNRSTLFKYTPGTGQVTTVASLTGYIYDLEVGRSGNLYVHLGDGIYVYSPDGVEQSRIIGPNYGFGLTLAEGQVFGSVYGCKDDYCGPWARVYVAPVDDGPLGGTSLLASTPERMVAAPGDTATTTVTVSVSDSSVVTVGLSTSAGWLTVSPDSGATPLTVTLSAVAPGSTAGVYVDTLVITSVGISNSPLRLPVTLEVQTNVMALGDTVVGSLSVEGEADTLQIQLNAGDTVDFSAYGGSSYTESVSMEIRSPSGSRAGGSITRSRPRRGQVYPAFPVAETGLYSLIIRSPSQNIVTYVVRTRTSGGVLAEIPHYGTSPRYWGDIPVQEGTTARTDTLWLVNVGRESSSWSATPLTSWISVSPSTGTLDPQPGAGLGSSGTSDSVVRSPDGEALMFGPGTDVGVYTSAAQAPAGATALAVTVDPTGWSPGTKVGYIEFEVTNDGWDGPHEYNVQMRVYDERITVVDGRLDDMPSGVADHPDGDLVLALGNDLVRVDPSSGNRTMWHAGVVTGRVRGLEIAGDGTAYLIDLGRGVTKVATDGTVTELHTASGLRDLALLPDASLYFTTGEGVFHRSASGTITTVASDGAYAGIAYHLDDGLVYAARGEVYTTGFDLIRIDPADQSVTTVATVSSSNAPGDLKVGASGRLYSSHHGLGANIRVFDTSGAIIEQIYGPGYDPGSNGGIGLTEGKVWSTSTFAYNTLYYLTVSDGPSRPPPDMSVRAWVPTDTVARGDTVAIPVYLDMSNTGKAIGSFQGRLAWDTAVVGFVSVSSGDFSGTFDSNPDSAALGLVRFAGISTSSSANTDTTKVAEVLVEVLGEGGSTTLLDLEMSGVAAVDFTSLDSDLTVVDGRLTVSTGLWGDPNKDKVITALDALICLSAVVGKDVSQFDAPACDVAPDGANNTFTGAVTALDALAILSSVVGKTLPDHFRVGDPR